MRELIRKQNLEEFDQLFEEWNRFEVKPLDAGQNFYNHKIKKEIFSKIFFDLIIRSKNILLYSASEEIKKNKFFQEIFEYKRGKYLLVSKEEALLYSSYEMWFGSEGDRGTLVFEVEDKMIVDDFLSKMKNPTFICNLTSMTGRSAINFVKNEIKKGSENYFLIFPQNTGMRTCSVTAKKELLQPLYDNIFETCKLTEKYLNLYGKGQ